jgi:hypothetical protein
MMSVRLPSAGLPSVRVMSHGAVWPTVRTLLADLALLTLRGPISSGRPALAVCLAVSAQATPVPAGRPRSADADAHDTDETACDVFLGPPPSCGIGPLPDVETKSGPPDNKLRCSSDRADAAERTSAGSLSTDRVCDARRNGHPLGKPNLNNHDELGPRERILPDGQVSERSPCSSPRRFFNTPSSAPQR